MNNSGFAFLLVISFMLSSGFIIRRDDVDDEAYLKMGESYSDIICHFPMGEGTLIDSSWILTAGHVGADLKRDLHAGLPAMAVVNGKNYEIDDVFVHPEFKPIINDVALVRIKEKIISKRYVRLNSEQKEIGNEIILVGMGDEGTGKSGPQKWDKKTRAATNRIDGADQNWIWFRFDKPGDENVTPLEGISGPGDSGGPALFVNNGSLYLFGISSNQQGRGQAKGTYGVMEYYTRVSSYVDWIKMTMENVPSAVFSGEKTMNDNKLVEYAGSYGIRKIVLKGEKLFFQIENEKPILMEEIGIDLFLWDDGNTRIKFQRNQNSEIVGFEIQRRNGERLMIKRD